MNKRILALAIGLSMVGGVAAEAQPPVDNVGLRHPHLDEAQHLTTQAFQALVASQQANEFDEGGHAAKAKELLDQANRQIAMAAHTDNKRERQ